MSHSFLSRAESCRYGSLLSCTAIVIVALLLTAVATRALGALLRRRGVEVGVRFGILKILRYALLVIGIFVAASSLGIRLDAVIATSAALAVGIGFGLQNIAQNFISGIILLIEQPVRKGTLSVSPSRSVSSTTSVCERRAS